MRPNRQTWGAVHHHSPVCLVALGIDTFCLPWQQRRRSSSNGEQFNNLLFSKPCILKIHLLIQFIEITIDIWILSENKNVQHIVRRISSGTSASTLSTDSLRPSMSWSCRAYRGKYRSTTVKDSLLRCRNRLLNSWSSKICQRPQPQHKLKHKENKQLKLQTDKWSDSYRIKGWIGSESTTFFIISSPPWETAVNRKSHWQCW